MYSMQLERNGLTISESDNTGAEPEFLAEMMEVNEEIHEGNPAPQRLRDIRASNSSELHLTVVVKVPRVEACSVP